MCCVKGVPCFSHFRSDEDVLSSDASSLSFDSNLQNGGIPGHVMHGGSMQVGGMQGGVIVNGGVMNGGVVDGGFVNPGLVNSAPVTHQMMNGGLVPQQTTIEVTGPQRVIEKGYNTLNVPSVTNYSVGTGRSRNDFRQGYEDPGHMYQMRRSASADNVQYQYNAAPPYSPMTPGSVFSDGSYRDGANSPYVIGGVHKQRVTR